MSAAEYLVSWLRFRASPTQDESGDTWTAYGSPTVSDNALQLNGSSYLKLKGGIRLGGKDFTIRGKATMNSNAMSWGGLFACNGNSLRIIRYKAESSAFELGYKGWLKKVSVSPALTTRFDFELDYEHSTGKWRTFFNGVLVNTYTNALARTYYANVVVGANGDNGEGYKWGGTIEEFQIYDGVALHTEDFTPPTAEDYETLATEFAALGEHVVNRFAVERIVQKTINITAALERKIKNAPLEWQYYNAGDTHDLTQTPTYLTDLPATKSTTGYAFYQTTRAKCFDLPATPQIWAKFDVYFDGSNRWRAYNGGSAGSCGLTAQTSGDLSFFSNGINVQQPTGICKTNQLQTVLLHMVSGTSGLIEAWVDGTKIYTYNGDVNHGDDFADFYLQSDGAGTFFSDVLISNEELIPKTTVIAAIERRLSNVVEATAAIERDLRLVTEESFAIERQIIINATEVTAAIERRLSNVVEATAAIERDLRLTVESTAAIERRLINEIQTSTAIERRLINSNTLTFDIEQQIVRAEELIFDIETELTFSGLLTRILPDSILNDPKFKASAIALDMQILAVFAAVKEVLHIPRLDELSGTILDLLAWQLHVDFYEPLYLSDEQKRSLIRQSIAWHRRKGTVAAVEELVAAVFKGATIQEWFDYGGEPYYFRIIAKSFAKSAEDYRTFRRAINVAKNVRSHLDYIAVDFSPEEPLKVKVGFGRRAVTGTKRILRDKPKDLRLRIGIGTRRYVIGHIGPILPPAPVEPMRLRISLGFGRLIRTGNIRWRNDHGNADPLDDDDPLPADYVGSYIWFRWLAATGKRGMRIRNPRDDVTEADLKTFMQYVVDNEVLRNSKGDLLTTALRASVLKTQEEIIPLDTSVHILPKQEEII